MCNIRLQAPILARKSDIHNSSRAGGRTYGRVITKISRMDR